MQSHAEPAAGRVRRALPRRVGLLAALAGLVSALAVVVAPAAARAAVPYPCPQHTDRGHYYEVLTNSWDSDEGKFGTHLVVYWLKSWQPVFDVAGSATEGNDTDSPQTKTFNITQSESHTVTQIHKASAKGQVSFLKVKLLEFGYEYTNQLVDSYTTSSSVTYTETLAPHTARRVYNGVDAVDVRFDVATWLVDGGKCWWRPNLTAYDVTRRVPTTSERRDVKAVPTINPGGIVDAVNNDGNIRPGEVITIYGNGFLAANRVILRQDGRTWAITGGSAGWYESYNQINFPMPYDVTSNSYISVSVESNLTVERGETLWPRQVFITP